MEVHRNKYICICNNTLYDDPKQCYCILLDMVDTPPQNKFGIVWQLGWFGMVQKYSDGGGNNFPTLLASEDVRDVWDCLSYHYFVHVFVGIVTSFGVIDQVLQAKISRSWLTDMFSWKHVANNIIRVGSPLSQYLYN
jgi:hypothetical protein